MKNNNCSDNDKQKELLEFLSDRGISVAEAYSYLPVEDSLRDICKLTKEDKEKYSELLQNLININKERESYSNNEKGKALENIVTFLLNKSGGIFEVKSNLHTSTNEIDNLVILNKKGKRFADSNLFDFKGEHFICECKNYADKVKVTYVGKFCSLVMHEGCRLGIMFSYHGLTGIGWNDGIGLTKKFHMRKEKLDERYYVIEFMIDDFKKVKEGYSFLELYESKIKALETDTNYEYLLGDHPAMSQDL